MAKLAVLILRPNKCTTHRSGFSGCSPDPRTNSRIASVVAFTATIETLLRPVGAADADTAPATHGVLPSDQSTPRSRASCSSVSGRKEPVRSRGEKTHQFRSVASFARRQKGKKRGACSGKNERTDTTDGKDLCCNAVGIPALELLRRRRRCVFVQIARLALSLSVVVGFIDHYA